VAGLVAFLNPAAAAAIAGIAPGAIQLGSLGLGAAVSCVLGFLLVAAISGADTPVVITGALWIGRLKLCEPRNELSFGIL
jgi:NAD/NADP transhydrogenase beta subunit